MPAIGSTRWPVSPPGSTGTSRCRSRYRSHRSDRRGAGRLIESSQRRGLSGRPASAPGASRRACVRLDRPACPFGDHGTGSTRTRPAAAPTPVAGLRVGGKTPLAMLLPSQGRHLRPSACARSLRVAGRERVNTASTDFVGRRLDAQRAAASAPKHPTARSRRRSHRRDDDPQGPATCRGHCRPGTDAASRKCQPATGATLSTMNRVRTQKPSCAAPSSKAKQEGYSTNTASDQRLRGGARGT